jgi:HD-GYP domain-containing protein (c-di-GMP phosphodiesterase class II)
MTDKPTHNKDRDPFEAIFALNMGDFVTEHLMTDDLMSRVGHTMTQDPQRLRNQLQELFQIYSLDNTLVLLGFESNEDGVLYDSIAVSLTEMLQVDACHIFQPIKRQNKPQYLSLTGTSVLGVTQNRLNIGFDLGQTDQVIASCYEDGFPIVVTDIEDCTLGTWQPLPELQQTQTKSFIAVPMLNGYDAAGLLLFESYTLKDFSQELVDLAEAVTKVFMASLRLQQLLDRSKKALAQETTAGTELLNLRAQLTEAIGDLGRSQQFFVESLSYAIDARNDFTEGHSQGVALIAKAIAENMALNEKTVDLVYYAGLLGAIGKFHIPQDILNKTGALTVQEREHLKSSANIGAGLLMKMNFLAEVIPYVDYQKERWDGHESPHGLSGRSIPLGARIIAVADAYHALTQPRPYRPEPLSKSDALAVLQKEAGSKWDPDIIVHLQQISK